MRISSVTRAAFWKIGGAVVAMLGAFGFADVRHAIGHALKHDTFGVVGIVLGVLIIAFGYGDSILSFFGVVRPERVDRQIRDWLHAQGYTVTPQPVPPAHFRYEIRDPRHDPFSYTVLMLKIAPFPCVEIGGNVTLSPEHAASMRLATSADRRDTSVRLTSTLLTSDPYLNVVHIDDLDPDNFHVVVTALVHVDELNFRSFIHVIHVVRKAVAIAVLILRDIAELIQERQPSAVSQYPPEISPPPSGS